MTAALAPVIRRCAACGLCVQSQTERLFLAHRCDPHRDPLPHVCYDGHRYHWFERMSKRTWVTRIGHLTAPLSKVPLGPFLFECPACLVEDTSQKVISDFGVFQNHVIRHLRRIYEQRHIVTWDLGLGAYAIALASDEFREV